jgi:predicted regulator of Ras-like GTPase activity (Roadblock/LC7/MglB family)
MDAREALAELTELSAQVDAAAVLGEDGSIEAATDDALGQRLADAARELLATAAAVRSAVEVTRVEVALPEGSVFVVREGPRSVVAVTIPDPTPGLVLYDLRTCLRRIDQPGPRRRRRTPKDADDS